MGLGTLGPLVADGFKSSGVSLLLPLPIWVEHANSHMWQVGHRPTGVCRLPACKLGKGHMARRHGSVGERTQVAKFNNYASTHVDVCRHI